MKKDDIIDDIKDSITTLVKDKYGKKSKEIEKEIESFLSETKGDFFRWGALLVDKKITEKEFELLLIAKKDVFVINQLHQLGVSKISLGHFKNNIIEIVFRAIIKALL